MKVMCYSIKKNLSDQIFTKREYLLRDIRQISIRIKVSNRRENVGMRNLRNPNALIDFSQTIDKI